MSTLVTFFREFYAVFFFFTKRLLFASGFNENSYQRLAFNELILL